MAGLREEKHCPLINRDILTAQEVIRRYEKIYAVFKMKKGDESVRKCLTDDERYMKEAVKQAKKASAIDEVPIGCVIVYDGKIIARGYNQRNKKGSTLAHAEIIAVGKASKVLGDWRLEGCTMYVTLEPCPMCAGAIVQARMDRVVIGAMNKKAGCAGSVTNLLQMDGFNHRVQITENVLEAECSSMLSSFFKELRERKKKQAAK